MFPKMNAPLAAAVLASGLISATSVLADNNAPAAAPTEGQKATDGPGMIGGTGNMMSEMNRMAANCNRMMESANQAPAAPAKPPSQTPPG